MKIAMIQTNPILGDLAGNYAKIVRAVERYKDKADIMVFPELALCGYYPQDLLLRPGFQEESDRLLLELAALTETFKAAIVIGHSKRNHFSGKPFFNALSVLVAGTIDFTYCKRLLCFYDIYDEPRHFEPGSGPATTMLKGKKTGFLICEDAWAGCPSGDGRSLYRVDPVLELMHDKPELVISINGSPSNYGKQALRQEIIGKAARTLNAPLVYVNQAGGQDAVVYDGASAVYSRDGVARYGLKSFCEDAAVVTLTDNFIWAGGEGLVESPQPGLELAGLYQTAVLGIRDYVAKTGFRQIVLGLSGGIDSAVVAALATAALGPENVIGLLMPSRHSSQGSIDDATRLADNLGIRHYLAPIQAEYALAVEDFETAFGEKPSRLTMENIQARIRGRKLMEYSNHNSGVMVLSTGNKSEVSVGYATLYGDMCGGLNPLGDLYKTDVYALAVYHNQQPDIGKIPEDSISKPPSAELFDGQQDSDSLPPYPVLDSILKLYIEGTQLTKGELELCRNVLYHQPDAPFEKIIKMVDGAEYKRQQSSTILRLRQLAFGNGRRLPITARCDGAVVAAELRRLAGLSS